MEVPNLISFNLITLAFNHCRHGPYWQFDAPALPVVHLERVRGGRKEEEKRKQFPHHQSVRNNLLLTSSPVTPSCNLIICVHTNWSVGREKKAIVTFANQCFKTLGLEGPLHVCVSVWENWRMSWRLNSGKQAKMDVLNCSWLNVRTAPFHELADRLRWILLPCSHCSWESLQIHHNPDRDKAVNEDNE